MIIWYVISLLLGQGQASTVQVGSGSILSKNTKGIPRIQDHSNG
jgi:hypothetical protein